MGITETLIFYGVVGLAAAAAMSLAANESAPRALALIVPRTVLWPFFAPGLFGDAIASARLQAPAAAPTDELSRLERDLVSALERLDGIAEEVLAPEVARVRNLVSELRRMRRRIDEMEELRTSPEFDRQRLDVALDALPGDDPRRATFLSRLRSVERLLTMHKKADLEFERVVLQLQELHSKILLLRFADDPEDEIVGLMLDISSSVEGVCAGAFDD